MLWRKRNKVRRLKVTQSREETSVGLQKEDGDLDTDDGDGGDGEK